MAEDLLPIEQAPFLVVNRPPPDLLPFKETILRAVCAAPSYLERAK